MGRLGGGVPHGSSQHGRQTANLHLVEVELPQTQEAGYLLSGPVEELIRTLRREDLAHRLQDHLFEPVGFRGFVLEHGELLQLGDADSVLARPCFAGLTFGARRTGSAWLDRAKVLDSPGARRE
jgi:hypothetical protein